MATLVDRPPGPVSPVTRAFVLDEMPTGRIRAWESLVIRKLGELESAGPNPAALTRQDGMWESMAIRLAWDQETAGSNPAIPRGRCDVTGIKRMPRSDGHIGAVV